MIVAMWMMVMIWTSKYAFDTNNKKLCYIFIVFIVMKAVYLS